MSGCRLPSAFCLALFVGACSQSAPAVKGAAPATGIILVTIDTLRADHVGVYGFAGARTPTLDALARDGARFDKAWATSPITLTSHASVFTGRYPPGHGARHNGIAMNHTVPTLATTLKAAGFRTAAFVSAFPLDRRFGLDRGFDVYDDQLPRAPDGRPLNERPGSDTVARASSWIRTQSGERFFLWVHLFEPHAPYGDPGASASRPTLARYDDEIATADREVGRLLAALDDRAASTLIVATSDHGEAFGEHGEIGHSVFVYDTTLRVPLILRGPLVPRGLVVSSDVSLVDVSPTILSLVDVAPMDADGRTLVPALDGRGLAGRVIYAESFAPLFDFGWAGLRAVRDGTWKYIAAPKPELYNLSEDPDESSNRVGDDPQRAARLETQASRWSAAEPGAAATAAANADAVSRLRALGYAGGSGGTNRLRQGYGGPPKLGAKAEVPPYGPRPDPKDRIALASRLATVTSGEVQGAALIATLEAILTDDPQNPQAHLRLGYAELQRNLCARAEPHLRAAIASGLPSADAGLGLAECRGRAGDLRGAGEALAAARVAEPGNPVVAANLGLLALQRGQVPRAIEEFRRALAIDSGLLEARFALARALARAGDRQNAAAEARTLLSQLPAGAPQRAEVERLLAAIR